LARVAFAPLAIFLLGRRYGFSHVNLKAMRRIAVYPGLALAYNRVKKNANTSVVILMRELETGSLESGWDAKDNSPSLRDLSIGQMLRLKDTAFFVVIRNPYTRVLSAFLDKLRDGRFKAAFGEFDLSPAGFRAFVFWLKAGGLDKNEHWDLQTKLMMLPLEKYERVIRFESLQPDMIGFLRRRNIKAGDGILATLYPSDLAKKTAADRKIADYYTDELKEAVFDLYREDFERLGYSPDFREALPNEGAITRTGPPANPASGALRVGRLPAPASPALPALRRAGRRRLHDSRRQRSARR